MRQPQRIDISVSVSVSGSSIAECSLTCVLCPAWPVSPPATTRGATAAGVRRAWSSERAGGRRRARPRRAARAGGRKRARRLCLRQVRMGVVRVRSVRATLGTAAFGTQGVWHGKGQRCQGPAWVLPRARLTCARVSSTLPLPLTLTSDAALHTTRRRRVLALHTSGRERFTPRAACSRHSRATSSSASASCCSRSLSTCNLTQLLSSGVYGVASSSWHSGRHSS